MKKYIGLTSPISTGMWVVTDELKKRGFVYFSLADRVREETRSQGLNGDRKTWQIIGDQLRENFGADVLAVRTLELIKKDYPELVIIDSIRHPAEVAYLREKLGDDFFVLGVDAPVEVRYKIMLERKRGVDALDWEGFLESHNKDIQTIRLVLPLVDLLIQHDGDLVQLELSVCRHF
jgi:dephospho-CoA kinase